MPGTQDSERIEHIYMSQWVKHRSAVSAVDATAASVTQRIDLSDSTSAIYNRVYVIPKRTAGTGSITISIYTKMKDSSGNAIAGLEAPILQQTSGATEDGTMIQFEDLYAGELIVKVDALSAGATFDLFVSHSDHKRGLR